jgi:predicted ATPase/serine/threonine protein kinase
VYHAFREIRAGLQRSVALKLIDGAVDSTAARRALLVEAKLGAQLNHPNIVRVFDQGIHEEQLYLVMELVEGLSLAQVVRVAGAVPPCWVRDIGLHICAALQEMHSLKIEGRSAGLVHRDIKPANVLINWEGQVKVADLGIAKGEHMKGAQTATGRLRGTPSYMSPEHLNGEVLDGRSDIFSLGSLLWELLTGHRLFTGRTVASTALAVVRATERFGEPGFWSRLEVLHEGLARVVQRCLAPNPKDRYPHASDVHQALAALEFDRPDSSLEQWLADVFAVWANQDPGTLDEGSETTLDLPPVQATAVPPQDNSLDTPISGDPETMEEAALAVIALEQSARPEESKESGVDGGRVPSLPPSLCVEHQGVPEAGGVVLHPDEGEVWRHGKKLLKMSPRQLPWRLLSHLLTHRDQSKAEIFPVVWQQAYRPPSSDNALHVALYRLRKRLASTGLVLVADDENRYHVQGNPSLWVWRRTSSVVDTSGSEPAGAAQAVRNGQIPATYGPFVGRNQELATLEKWLAATDRRLKTVRGPPGTGKTRLCLESLQRREASGAGNSLFCDLSEAHSLIGVLRAVAAALAVPLGNATKEFDLIEQLGHAIKARGRLLMLLDNAEQVQKEVAQVVSTWRTSVPDVRFLVTSRVPLGLPGEQVMVLEPLGLPSSQHFEDVQRSEAVTLFVERAMEVRPGFALSRENMDDVRTVVCQLDGMPLAIELASARVRMMSPKDIASRLNQRFRLLRKTPSGPKDRRNALEAAIDESWEILSPYERHALAQCAVFHGGFSLEAAESILQLDASPDAPWIVDVLERLLDHSLVYTRETALGTRFYMYRSIHAYAKKRLAERSGEELSAQERHARYFSRFGNSDFIRSFDHFGGVREKVILETELENLLAAAEVSLANGWTSVAGATAIACIHVFIQKGPVQSGQMWAKKALDMPNTVITRGRLLLYLGTISRIRADSKQAKLYFEEALVLFEQNSDAFHQVQALCSLGRLFYLTGPQVTAYAYFQQALAICEERNPSLRAEPLLGLAMLDYMSSNYEKAYSYASESLRVFRRGGDKFNEATALSIFYAVARARGKFSKTLEVSDQVLKLFHETGNARSESIALGNRGNLFRGMGEHETAIELYEQAITQLRSIGNVTAMAVYLGNLGGLQYLLGNYDDAFSSLTEAVGMSEKINRNAAASQRGVLALTLQERGDSKGALAMIHQAVEEIELSRYADHGILLCQLGTILAGTGDEESARVVLDKVLTLAREHHKENHSDLSRSIATLQALLEREAER